VERALNASGRRARACCTSAPPRCSTHEKTGTGLARGASSRLAAPPSRAGRGRERAYGGAGGASWAPRRARREVERRAQHSPSTLVMAYHGSPHGPGMCLGVQTAAGDRLFGAHSTVGAVWQHAFFHRRLGGLRAACGGRAAHAWEGHSQTSERTHINGRTRSKRWVRRTICGAKTERRHDVVIGFFINRYELGRLLGHGINSSETPLRLLRTRGHVEQGEGRWTCLPIRTQPI